MKKLAVLILNWNGQQFLSSLLENIFCKLNNEHCDIYVIDNNSSDASVDIIRKNFNEVKLIIHEKNWGFAEGYNLAFNQLIDKYEYFFLLNNDAFISGVSLNKIILKLSKISENTGMIALKMLKSDRATVDAIGITLHPSGLGFNAKSMYDNIFCPCGGAAIYRTKMLQNIFNISGEYFDKMFGFYYEDLDIGFRARLCGWHCEYFDSEQIIHYHSQSMKKKKSTFSSYYIQRNQIWCIIKNFPTRLFWKYIFKIIFAQLLQILYYLFHGSFFTIMKAKYSACIHLYAILQKRKTIQRSRTVSINEINCLFSKKSLYALWRS